MAGAVPLHSSLDSGLRGAYRRLEILSGEWKLLNSGRRGRARTCDPQFWRLMLYQLSYAPMRLKVYTSADEDEAQ